MNETLTELAVEYGWGCPTCKGLGRYQWNGRGPTFTCSDCHGNRVTEADKAEFERLVVAVATRLPKVWASMEECPNCALRREAVEKYGHDSDCAFRSLESLQRPKAATP